MKKHINWEVVIGHLFVWGVFVIFDYAIEKELSKKGRIRTNEH